MISKKYFLILVAISFLIIVGYRYKQYIIDKNFIIETISSCDKNTENCFNPSEEISDVPYKKIRIVAKFTPNCLEEHTCEVFSCSMVKGFCEVTYCSKDTVAEGESCVN